MCAEEVVNLQFRNKPSASLFVQNQTVNEIDLKSAAADKKHPTLRITDWNLSTKLNRLEINVD